MGKPYWQPSVKANDDGKEDFLVSQLGLLDSGGCEADSHTVSGNVAVGETSDCCWSTLPGSMATETLQTPRPTSASGSAPSA